MNPAAATLVVVPALHRHDLEGLTRFGITVGQLAAAGVVRVTDDEARRDYGLTFSGDCTGLVFPYRSPVTGARVTCRVRRDRPEVDPEGRPLNKYVTPYGDRHHLYFGTDAPARLADVSARVILVEAEKSALALEALAHRTGQAWLVIGVGGCWGWRGKRGLAEAPDGGKVEERGPLPDLDVVTWTDREVVIVFDANVATNSKVQAARGALAKELASRGALVKLADLPTEEGVNGPDDYLASHDDQTALTLVRTARTYAPPRDAGQRVNQATALVQLAKSAGAEFFASEDSTPYVSLPVGGHVETYPIRSRFVREWLARLAYCETGTIPGAQAVADAVTTLTGMAKWDGTTIPVFVRVASVDGRIYLDLGTPTWDVIEIDAAGWRVSSTSPVRFRRPFGLLALPRPTPDGAIGLLRPFLNVQPDGDEAGDQDDAFRLCVAWQLAALRGAGPYPALVLLGEQGSAKSSTARALREVFDPNATTLRAQPRDERDLFIQASNSHVIALDNLSTLPNWLSDGLCRLTSGTGFSTRALFTDSEEQLFTGARPVILNGIESVATRGDLLDRLITIETPVIADSKRRDERELWARFAQVRPQALGALLTGVSTALRRLPETRLETLPRMADFALWTAAAEVAFDWTETVSIYLTNRQANVETLLATDLLAKVVREFAEEQAPAWTGEYGDLLDRLTRKVPERVQKDRHAWPTSERALSGRLRRLAPQLRRVGVDLLFDLKDSKTSNRLLRIVRTVQTDQPEVAPDDSDGSDGCLHTSDAKGVLL